MPHESILVEILEEVRELRVQVKRIISALFPVAQSATLTIGDTDMPATLPVGKTATAVLHEWTGPNGTGTEVKPVGPVSYTSSDPTIATVDPTSGLVTAVAAGTATITGTDAGNGLTASETVSDTLPAAVSATLVVTPN